MTRPDAGQPHPPRAGQPHPLQAASLGAAPVGTAGFDYGELLNCMRCGFCLPTCPTYVETGNEAASPRGRIAQMKAAADGLVSLAQIQDQVDLCLGCLNCVTACPAGVQYGHLLEDAREALATARRPRFVERLLLNWVTPRPWVLRAGAALLWFYQASGLRWLAQRTGLTRLLPGQVRDMERILPRVPPPWRRRHPRTTRPARSEPGLTSYRSPSSGARFPTGGPHVAFFTGCIMDVLFWEANRASIALLADAGCTVTVLETQTCCGALHAHAGHKEAARRLARKNIAAFEAGSFDFVVNSIGGCGAALKEYGHWLKDDPEWYSRAVAFAGKVRDLSELLVELGYQPPRRREGVGGVGAPGATEEEPVVTFQHSCHLTHGQGVRTQPLELLHRSGARVREMQAADRCCGSAGVYNLLQPDMANRVLATKMQHARATGAHIIVTVNPGCQLQMRLGVLRAGLSGEVEVVHLAEWLARSLPRRPAGNEVT